MKYLFIEIDEKPLSLNEMMLKNKKSVFAYLQFKRKYFSKLEKQIEKTEFYKTNKSGHTFYRQTKSKLQKDPVRYLKFYSPVFNKPDIKWILNFKRKVKIDRKNFIGGLKWIEDCIVNMNIISDDSIEDFCSESYEIEFGKKDSIGIEISEKN